MKKSTFDKLAAVGTISKTATLTKVTFHTQKDCDLLTSQLKIDDTPFKISKQTVTIKTNVISGYADLAEFILTGKKTK